jgi:hypothetical protein
VYFSSTVSDLRGEVMWDSSFIFIFIWSCWPIPQGRWWWAAFVAPESGPSTSPTLISGRRDTHVGVEHLIAQTQTPVKARAQKSSKREITWTCLGMASIMVTQGLRLAWEEIFSLDRYQWCLYALDNMYGVLCSMSMILRVSRDYVPGNQAFSNSTS